MKHNKSVCAGRLPDIIIRTAFSKFLTFLISIFYNLYSYKFLYILNVCRRFGFFIVRSLYPAPVTNSNRALNPY